MRASAKAPQKMADRGRPLLGLAATAALALALVPAAATHADTNDGQRVAAEFEQVGGGQLPGVQIAAVVSLTDAGGNPVASTAGISARLTDGSGVRTPVQLSPLAEGQFLFEAHPDHPGSAELEVLVDGQVVQSAEVQVSGQTRTLTARPDDLTLGRPTPVSPGVRHQEVFTSVDGEPVQGDLLTVDLRYSTVELGLLNTGVVGASAPTTEQVAELEAVAGVNGDFFDISGSDHHPDPTYAPVGPAIADGTDFGGPVPQAQRFGLPPTAEPNHNQTVFAAGADGAVITELSVTGTVTTSQAQIEISGLDQYALAENGVGVFTPLWGTSSRLRATCGSDTGRNDPCAEETREIVVTDGVVTEVRDEPGSGPIGTGQVVLVGREDGAHALDSLSLGDAVSVNTGLNAATDADLDVAVGGFPILRDGAPIADLDEEVFAPRTGVGIDAGGETVYLLTIDGGAEHSIGYTIASMAQALLELGATDGLNLDGGGSTTMVTNGQRDDGVTLQNVPSGSMERPVPNGIGVFSHRP